MKILCTICARSGSKGIKNKNFLKIDHKTLTQIAINLAKDSKIFNKIVFSSDSQSYCNRSIKYGADMAFLRNKKLSNDYTGKIEVIKNLLAKAESHYNFKFDIICDLDVTTPLKNINDLKLSFNKFLKKNYDILFSVCESKKSPYFNMIEKKNSIFKLIKNSKFRRRQDLPKTYFINAGIYIWKRKTLIVNKTLFCKNNGIYEMPYERSIDIDSLDDYKLVKLLKNGY